MYFREVVQVLLVLACCSCVVDGVSIEKDLSLTLSEKKALDKFRIKVGPLLTKPHMQHPIYLIRWLRARDFNLNSAENLLRQNLRWRQEKNMDTILQEDFSDIAGDFHATIDTYDRKGRPLGVIDVYDWDIRKAILQGKGHRLLRYMDYCMENVTRRVFDRMNAGISNATQWSVLGNADGFNLIEHGCALCVPLWIQFIQGVEAHFTGWLDEFIIIDAPSSVNVILEAIRPFLSKQTRDSIRIFSANRNKWMPYLDERISKEERRPQYGGTKPPVKY